MSVPWSPDTLFVDCGGLGMGVVDGTEEGAVSSGVAPWMAVAIRVAAYEWLVRWAREAVTFQQTAQRY